MVSIGTPVTLRIHTLLERKQMIGWLANDVSRLINCWHSSCWGRYPPPVSSSRLAQLVFNGAARFESLAAVADLCCRQVQQPPPSSSSHLGTLACCLPVSTFLPAGPLDQGKVHLWQPLLVCIRSRQLIIQGMHVWGCVPVDGGWVWGVFCTLVLSAVEASRAVIVLSTVPTGRAVHHHIAGLSLCEMSLPLPLPPSVLS